MDIFKNVDPNFNLEEKIQKNFITQVGRFYSLLTID